MKLMTKWARLSNGSYCRMHVAEGKQRFIVAHAEYVGPTFDYYTNQYSDDAYWDGTIYRTAAVNLHYSHTELVLLQDLIDSDLRDWGWIEVPDKYKAML